MRYCAFAECERPAYHGDLCNAHRQQRKRGVQLRPLQEPQGGKFGGEVARRLKRAAIAYADSELEDHDRAWKNLADAARWYVLGVPKSANRSVTDAFANVREAMRKLEAQAQKRPRTPERAL